MERIINIDGRDVKFRSSGAFPMLYRAETGRDFFADMARISENGDEMTAFDSEALYDIAYCLAKSADKKIGNKYDWFDGFASFPIFEVFPQLNDLLVVTMQTLKKA